MNQKQTMKRKTELKEDENHQNKSNNCINNSFHNMFVGFKISCDVFAFPPDMFHDMFVHKSGLGRAQGTENEIFVPQRPTKGL